MTISKRLLMLVFTMLVWALLEPDNASCQSQQQIDQLIAIHNSTSTSIARKIYIERMMQELDPRVYREWRYGMTISVPPSSSVSSTQTAADPAFAFQSVSVSPTAGGGAKPIIHVTLSGIADEATIKIYDVAGRQRQSANLGSPNILNNGRGDSQYAYEYQWNAHAPSGVYIYVVIARKAGHAPIKKAGKLVIIR